MLYNFCDPRLRPEIQCSTVSTEGCEVTNLISDSDKGFLAYACIKPPINIDVNFVCNVSIDHILIWPRVGSQKSSGFQLYAKTSNDVSVPYVLLSTGFLDSSNDGLLFYPSNVDSEAISAPSTFLKRYIKRSLCHLTTYACSLRICICKTENSVPALAKLQVWGVVSPRCGKDTVASISALWFQQRSCSLESVEVDTPKDNDTPVAIAAEETLESSLEVPECFLDAITYEIMTQPIVLPSGKIIDQTTLLKHEETEALWGRRSTDPFTGLPFSEDRKPVIASGLKIRIDKFLLENSNVEEIKRLPRVLGRVTSSSRVSDTRTTEVPKYLLRSNATSKTPKLHSPTVNVQKRESICHKLPVVVTSRKRNAHVVTKPAKRKTTADSCTKTRSDQATVPNSTGDDETDISTAALNLKRFNAIPETNTSSTEVIDCSCCSETIFYRLPCNHVLCRKVLTSIENNQCTSCGMDYTNSQVERIHE
ncbi:RING finger protein 37 [Ceratina calcarata]|uniref:RING finger protein 37 n=1 Tax=Ceratina calcarata TaxID=156304 RepID=A0AAJ7NAZ4_9HYME|nr:RING finger protein 37 [Ceratina calcarata]